MKQILLFCISENHGIDGLEVEDSKTYGVLKDNYGEFFEDDNNNEHYLADLDWEKVFNLIS